ncbi:MFS transporter [Gorillibacterium massiliense]|uniref:MFS transporter n=1 Tax=Gorillibacterium massiliense TaxID=1280390 RepID=UPI0004B03240|nr:MFS transporter [Gorillibacterium massiliense]
MATFFLIIIYLAFISLGLPDSLLGTAWPVMQPELGASLDTAGLLSMTIAGCTIISSLASARVLKRFGTGMVTFVSCLLTAAALFGYSYAHSLWLLVLMSIPLGLGAGAIDSGLNNYVATHYKAHHMSWLHCFWGVGATFGPIIMAGFISGAGTWRDGYLTIAGVQGVLVVILFFALPLWNKVASLSSGASQTHEAVSTEEAIAEMAANPEKPLRIKGVKMAMLVFLFYCGVEAGVGLWGASFLVEKKELAASSAAHWISLYYAGITVGRFITGFITLKMSNKALIRLGQTIALTGALLMLLPLPEGFMLAGLILTGLGLAPIFPCMLHETPVRFGKRHSQAIMGYQMAFAYTGSTFLPPLLGLTASYTTIGIFPFVIAILAAAMFLAAERLNGLMQRKQNPHSKAL